MAIEVEAKGIDGAIFDGIGIGDDGMTGDNVLLILQEIRSFNIAHNSLFVTSLTDRD